MIDNKKILAVIPARGGSKGVPLKNIRPVKGTPLIALVGPIVKAVKEIDRAVVSTDHPEIMKIAKAAGIDAPFTRPESLSGDLIGDWDVLHHALLEMEKMDSCVYDIILLLPPTSPMRTADHVRDVLKKMIDGNYDSVWTVSTADLKFHPLKQLVIEDEKMRLYDPEGKKIIARQQLKPVYYRNGVVYAMTRACLETQKSILGNKAGAVVIDTPLVNIDTVEDFERLERLLSK